MSSLFTAFGIFFFLVLIVGNILERIQVPWIFSALFIGILAGNSAIFGSDLVKEELFIFSTIGMSLLLFSIGFGLDIDNILKYRGQIGKITTAVILSESIVGTLFLHFIFGVEWSIAMIVSISFSTVGEAALLPILDEFNIIKTRLGQTALSVGILDDIVEILVFILGIGYIGMATSTVSNIDIAILLAFLTLAVLTYIIRKRLPNIKLKFAKYDFYYLFIFSSIFLIASVLKSVEILPLVAIFLGFILQNLIPQTAKIPVGKFIKSTTMVVFAPFFFFEAGLETDLNVLKTNFLSIILLTLIIKATKILSTYFSSRSYFGTKKSILMGICLSIKFSTSIILLFALLNAGIITRELFSILIGVKILFKFIAPLLISFLIRAWKMEFEYVTS